MRTRRTACVAALTALSTACGLAVTGVAPTPLDDTETSRPSADAGPDTTTSSTDGAPPLDDGAIPPDGQAPDAGLGFCESLATRPTFCEDFDDRASGVLRGETTTGDRTTISTQLTVSSSVTLDMDVRWDHVPTYPGFVSAFVIAPLSGGIFYFFVSSEKSYFQQAADEYSAMPPMPTLGNWHHLTLAIKISSNTLVEGSLDGVSYWKQHTAAHPWSTGTTVTFKLGLADFYSASDATLSIDNVVIRTN